MTKKELHHIIKELGIHQWELAREVGVVESTFVVWLRADLEGERLERVQAALKRIEAREGK